MGSEVTAEDREKATRLWSERDIAQALADERVKARAPFLRLADEYDANDRVTAALENWNRRHR